jgi:hypothetical protein
MGKITSARLSEISRKLDETDLLWVFLLEQQRFFMGLIVR